jgi:ABC-type transport system involved in cytochrome bd biosynthesis fused ATPase/permease subunit
VRVEKRLPERGLVLPAVTKLPAGVRTFFNWVRVRRNRALVSGHGPLPPTGHRQGPSAECLAKLPLEDAQNSARLAGLAILSSLKQTQCAGAIHWNGQCVDDPATFFVPPRSAYAPQVPRLFSESLRENLLLGHYADSGALKRAIGSAVLEPNVAVLEHGLDTLVGPHGVKLSGGHIQRAAAARMFVRDAELLVFDDISSALVTDTEAELWRRLFARRDDITCLIVSHRPAALAQADQVLTLERGRLDTATAHDFVISS